MNLEAGSTQKPKPMALLTLIILIGSVVPLAAFLLVTEGSSVGGDVWQYYDLVWMSKFHLLLGAGLLFLSAATAMLALTHYVIKRELAIPLFGGALAINGVLEAVHGVLLSDFVEPVLAFGSWWCLQTFSAISLLAAMALYSLSRLSTQEYDKQILGVSIAVGALLLSISSIQVWQPQWLVNYLQTNSLAAVLVSYVPLQLWLFAGIVVYPLFYNQVPNFVISAIFIGVIPQAVAEIYILARSDYLYDGQFLVAHLLRALGFVIPWAALSLNFIRAYRKDAENTSRLDAARETLSVQAKQLVQANGSLESHIAERQLIEQELRHQLMVEEMLASISRLFVLEPTPNLAEVLRYLGEVFGAEIGYLLVSDPQTQKESLHCWHNNVGYLDHNDRYLSLYMEEEWLSLLKAGQHIVVTDCQSVPDGSFLQALCKFRRARSLVLVPIMRNEHNYAGFIEYDSLSGGHRWTERDAQVVRVVAEYIASYFDRKTAYQALENSERRFRQLTEATFEGILIHQKRKIIEVNPALAEMFGYSAPELEGSSILGLIAPKSIPEVEQMTATTRWNPTDILGVRKDGSQFLCEISAKEIDYRGETVQVVVVRDVTEHRDAIQDLAFSEARFRSFIEGSNDVVTVLTENNQIAYQSPTEAYLCVPDEHYNSEHFLSYVDPEDREIAATVLKEFWRTEHQSKRFEVRFMKANGEHAYMESMLSWIEFRDQKACLINSRDVTHRKLYEQNITESESRHRALVEAIPDAMIRVDESGTILDFEIPEEDMLSERMNESVLEKKVWEVLPELQAQRFAQMLQTVLHNNVSEIYDVTIATDQGTSYREVRMNPGESNQALVLLRDTTETRRAIEALRESEERYALAALGANDGLWDWDVPSNQIYFSPRWWAILGYDAHEMENSVEAWFSRVHPEDLEALKQSLFVEQWGVLTHLEAEFRMFHSDGSIRWILCRGIAVSDSEGKLKRLAGSQTDITDRKSAEEQLLHDAFHDSLTNLPNRALMVDHLENAVARAKRHKDYKFAVLFLDLDSFKVVNDSLGHLAGDQLLIKIARRLESCVRPGDTVARLGGDEFTVLLDYIHDFDEAEVVAERIHCALERPFNLDGQNVFSSASMGIAQSSAEYESAEDILRDADTAMYQAKFKGRGQREVFEKDMHTTAVELLQLETDLRLAVERNEFVLHYQPILDIDNREVLGFEALVRWNHPKRGLLSPTDFIPTAEETGLIVPIGRWVLMEGCKHLREWQQENSDIYLSVNMSSQQLAEEQIYEDVSHALTQTGINPNTLKIEITESLLVNNEDTTRGLLKRITELGVHLYIDDFGTGYSSLSYLHRFPINSLKIDRSFVNRLGSGRGAPSVVGTILSLADNMGINVIAEGVENEFQVNELKELRCRFAQGFYYSEPLELLQAASLAKSPTLPARQLH